MAADGVLTQLYQHGYTVPGSSVLARSCGHVPLRRPCRQPSGSGWWPGG